MVGMSTFKTIASTAVLTLGLASAAQALPALQLGPDSDADWSYDVVTETWVLATGTASVMAYANDTQANGGNGDYAWDHTGGDQIAYLVVSALPSTELGDGDVFDVIVTHDTMGALSLYDSGYGKPPVEDPNSLAGHGVYETYFEIYAFEFDGSSDTILNTQPGEAGSGKGFTEALAISGINLNGITGIHFDLFTTTGDVLYTKSGVPAKGGKPPEVVEAFAPFSHDAEFGCCSEKVPEPGPLGLLGAGMIALYIARRRRLAS